jgi:hypothetical protein
METGMWLVAGATPPDKFAAGLGLLLTAPVDVFIDLVTPALDGR